jgi:uncharacterized protein with HEPN domain
LGPHGLFMTKKRPNEAYLLDMKKAAQSVLEFTKGMDAANFDKDAKCQSAVLYQLAVLGEAAKHVSKDFRELHPELPWKKVAGLRDILIHAYHGLDMEVIWKIIESDLPPLLDRLEKL